MVDRRLGEVGFEAADAVRSRRAGVLVDYMILTAIGRLLTARGLRRDEWLTDCHRKVAHREDIDYDELKGALYAATLTWYACAAVSVVIAVSYGFIANAIEGNIRGVASVVFTSLFGLLDLSVILAAESAVRARLLNASGRVRKPVADEMKVRRYRPGPFDFWGATVIAIGITIILLTRSR